jgi:hypothetical protein
MNWEIIRDLIPYLISGAAFFLAFKKQKHEEVGIDANTIKTFADTTGVVGKQYKDLLTDFNLYKSRTDKAMAKLQGQLADVVQKNNTLQLSLLVEKTERKKLEKEFEKVKNENFVLAESNKDLKATNILQAKTITSLTKWVEKLCNQLKNNNITPEPCDDK